MEILCSAFESETEKLRSLSEPGQADPQVHDRPIASVGGLVDAPELELAALSRVRPLTGCYKLQDLGILEGPCGDPLWSRRRRRISGDDESYLVHPSNREGARC